MKWTRALSDYSYADGWRLSYAIRGVKVLDVDAVADTDGIRHAITIAATDSAKLDAGDYQWFARVMLSDEVTTVGRGVLTVEPNPTKAQAGDLQAAEEKLLATIEKTILLIAANPHASYAIEGRAVTFQNIGEWETLAQAIRGRLARRRGARPPSHELRFRAAR